MPTLRAAAGRDQALGRPHARRLLQSRAVLGLFVNRKMQTVMKFSHENQHYIYKQTGKTHEANFAGKEIRY